MSRKKYSKELFEAINRCFIPEYISVYKQLWEKHKYLFYSIVCIEFIYFSFIPGCGNDNKTRFEIETSEVTSIEQVSGEKSENGAIVASRKFVKNRLEFLRAATFPGYNADVATHVNNLYLVRSYVDTWNDCGPKARRYYTCLLRFEKGSWILEELKFY